MKNSYVFCETKFILNEEPTGFLIKSLEFVTDEEELHYSDGKIYKIPMIGLYTVTSMCECKYRWMEGTVDFAFDSGAQTVKATTTTPAAVDSSECVFNEAMSPIYDSLAPYFGANTELASFSPRPEVRKLPGMNEKTKHPVTGAVHRLDDIIMNLNDKHKWTREQIADWLETLDIDLRFK